MWRMALGSYFCHRAAFVVLGLNPAQLFMRSRDAAVFRMCSFVRGDSALPEGASIPLPAKLLFLFWGLDGGGRNLVGGNNNR